MSSGFGVRCPWALILALTCAGRQASACLRFPLHQMGKVSAPTSEVAVWFKGAMYIARRAQGLAPVSSKGMAF